MATTKKNDATGENVSFEYGGHTYSVPPAEEWDIEVLEAVDAQQMTVALRALLGGDQYAKFRANHRKVRELGEFFEAANKAVEGGNS